MMMQGKDRTKTVPREKLLKLPLKCVHFYYACYSALFTRTNDQINFFSLDLKASYRVGPPPELHMQVNTALMHDESHVNADQHSFNN